VSKRLSGISFRLAKVGVALAFVLGLSMSLIQLYLDYIAQSDNLDIVLTSVAEVIEPPASRAVHTLDDDLSLEVVNSLLAYDFVYNVAIKDELGNTLASGSKPRQESATGWLTNLLQADNKRIYTADLSIPDYGRGAVGQVIFHVDVDMALASFYDRSVLVLISGVLRNCLLVILLFFAFYRLLAKPLLQMSNEIIEIQPNHPGEKRLTVINSESPDELTGLSMAVNSLMDSVEHTLSRRMEAEESARESEELIRRVFNEMPSMIAVRDLEGVISYSNPNFDAFCGLQEGEAIGQNMFGADFDFFFNKQQDLKQRLKENGLQEQPGTIEFDGYFHNSAGETLYLQCHSTPIVMSGESYILMVLNDISDRRQVEEKMEYMAYHDTLTGLPNRPHLVERLENEIMRSRRHHYYGAVLFIDLDHFKNINDSLGHSVGDELLRQVARRLRSVVREEDVVSRLSGDEFVVVLTILDDDFDTACLKAGEVAEKIRQTICDPYPHEDIRLHISCSIGVKIYEEDRTSADELLRFADTAMYQVKSRGRNAVEFFNVEMSEKVSKQLLLEAELHKAYENSEFILYFQPKYFARTRKIKGAEALIRWQHPERGMVSPGEFIPQLESSGLMFDVGYWIIQEGCRTAKSMQVLGLWQQGMRMSINISPRQLLDVNFTDGVKRILAEEAIDGGVLDFEVTESVAIDNIENSIETMNKLIELNISFSLDDFGTGYSSISYLKRLPVENLKIDYSFVRDIEEDYNDRALVKMIVAMGHMLDLNVVAEGVETDGQMAILDNFGCHYYQGYLLSRPIPKTDFKDLLQAQFDNS
jgi:diguanylate cyclase (GGDEF)-like protein/PAS domain S-box-containing protein